MATDEWFRNTTWDSNIETEFEARLKRSRGAYNKAQYLRIQASYLLDNSDKEIQLVGVRLMDRLIKDFPTEEFSTIFGHEQLGDYYFKTGEFDKAEKHFRLVTEHYIIKNTRGGTSATADLKLAETILTANWTEKFDEAYSICKNFPLDKLTFNSEKYYYAVLTAQICDKLNKKEEAKDFALTAIEISKITEPQFNRHKTVGLVRATEKQLRTLEQIANG
jgi:tetratricopeptide (TPR) repeat protein